MLTDLFDTVKFQGSLGVNKVTWIGTGPRSLPPASRMQAELTARGGSFFYAETLFNGDKRIGEIRATCNQIE